ncbi:ABC transporter permease [Lacticaseibacillus camelliae DSM 22697 = JCM 13995]|uniref:ABC transporter permease n=1 Tax=Lacticaseibacillus camelliae DSM 22697 = JCM 13995 TaxID=1423730 RepID=A0A0R2F9X6_9LACO|nr:ABC transporter permease [Lacticaseibacillus camelliae DSM 22697 = JCM 13995]
MRLDLHRDWLKIGLWIAGLAGLMASAAAKFESIYGTPKAMASIAKTLKTPAMVSLLGPFTATPPFSSAVIYGAEMMVFMGLFAAMMNIYFAVHATRAEEDTGTTELILAHAVGRQSPLLAAIVELVLINAVAGILEALGLQAASMPGANALGSWLFGLGLAAFGFMFGTFSLLFAQMVSSARAATMLSYVWLGLLYMTRMGTDVQNPNLTCWTVFGWIEKMQLYTANVWTPIWLMLGLSAGVLLGAVGLANARDIGAGLVEPRAGRSTASRFLQGPLMLLARLERTSTIIWLIGLFVLGAAYGSIFGTVGDLVKSNPMMAKLLGNSGVNAANRAVVLGLANTLVVIFAVVAAVPAISILLRLNADERKGYLELLHAAPVSRLRLFLSHTIQAVSVGTLALALGVLGMAVAGNASMTTTISLARFMRGFIGYWPALLVVCGIAALLVGLLPRLQALIWVVPVYGVLSMFLGPMLDFPKWAERLSPFGWVNAVPTHAVAWPTFAWMTALGIALFGLAYVGYRRRDLTMN